MQTERPDEIRIERYDYPLPDERIARYPLPRRDQSKLLVYRGGAIEQVTFCNLPELLPEGSMLIFNNTKVIHARLLMHKSAGSTIEIFCLEPWQEPLSTAFEQRHHSTWVCLIGNNKKWKEDTLSMKIGDNHEDIVLQATRREPCGNAWLVDFDWTGDISFAELIDMAGQVPLPPYLNRQAEESDKERYQTVYALNEGSVAAPTAGLHFTDELMDTLHNKGFSTEFITLHVGAGTFKPVTTATIGEHEMHVEKIQISKDNLIHIMSHRDGLRIAVGTTTVRTLESVYWFGVQLENKPDIDAMTIGQWLPYDTGNAKIPVEKSFNNVIWWMDRHQTDVLFGETQLMIAPGYTYHVIEGLITNFHQPKSTLLLLVSALIGDSWRQCYQYALDHGFRFLSYGDSCLFLNK